jgi:hypothetical protein
MRSTRRLQVGEGWNCETSFSLYDGIHEIAMVSPQLLQLLSSTITGVGGFDSLRSVRVIPYEKFIPLIISLFIRFGAQVRKLGLLLGC